MKSFSIRSADGRDNLRYLCKRHEADAALRSGARTIAGRHVPRTGCRVLCDAEKQNMDAESAGTQRSGQIATKDKNLKETNKEDITEIDIIIKTLNEVTRLPRQLEKKIDENINTKREIKEIGLKLGRKVDAINRKSITKWLEEKKLESTMSQTGSVDMSAQAVTKQDATRPDLKDMGVQTCSIETAREESERLNIEKVRKLLKNKAEHNDEQFLETIKQDWPEQVYQNAQLKQGDLLQIEGNIAVYIEGNNTESGITQRLCERYPELKQMEHDEDKLGVGFVKNITNIRQGQYLHTKEKIIFKLAAPKDANDSNRSIIYRDVIKELSEVAEEETITSIYTIAPAEIPPHEARKIAEYTLRNSTLGITLLMAKGNASRKIKKTTGEKSTKNNREHAVVVKAEGRQYADILKELKSQTAEDIEVNNVKKTRKGDLLLVLKGGKEAADKAKSIIMQKTRCQNVVSKDNSKRKILHIAGMDCETTRDEVQKCIAAEVAEAQEEINVTSIRPAYAETQKATIVVKEEIARKMLERQRVKIGWTICRVRMQSQ